MTRSTLTRHSGRGKPSSPDQRDRESQPKSRKRFLEWKEVKHFLKSAGRPKSYWIVLIGLLVAGALAGELCERYDLALRERYWLYQKIVDLKPWKSRADRTALVLVRDSEFQRDLKARSPIRGDYLAALLRAVAAAQPPIIAIDFQLSVPERSRAEDRELLKAIREVAARHIPVVLPVTLVPKGDKYAPEQQVYSGEDLGSSVRTGHIGAFQDVRAIPVGLRLADGTRQDSFAEAIVKLDSPDALADFTNEDDQPFATFVPPERFRQIGAAEALTGNETVRGKLRTRIVIISGDWIKNRLTGEHVDSWPSPVGMIPGSMLQANYVEALLGSRVYHEANAGLGVTLELLPALLLALLFAFRKISWVKFAGLCLLAVLSGYVLLENIGRYYDFYFPLLFLVGHGAVEQYREMWSELHPERRVRRWRQSAGSV